MAVADDMGGAPREPDHGFNESTFHALWSHEPPGAIENPNSEAEAFRNQTDIPFSEPPKEVEKWNERDVEDFPGGDTSTSIYPPGADLQDSSGGLIEDAHASVFAVQPSTKTYLDQDEQPLYVPSSGSVLGTIDYRVNLPSGTSGTTRRVDYSIDTTEIKDVKAIGKVSTGDIEEREEILGTGDGDHAVEIEYANLPRGEHELGLEAEVSVTIEIETQTRSCSRNESTGQRECGSWSTSTELETESVTVQDLIEVEQYDIQTTGYATEYPDGDIGVVIQRNVPWESATMPNGDRAAGVWHFYSGRDTKWDTLQESSHRGTEEIDSPLNPLQVHAYPFEGGVRMSGEAGTYSVPKGKILNDQGDEFDPPDLPDEVAVDVVDEPYDMSSQLAIRHPANQGHVTVNGIVRGVSEEIPSTLYTNVDIQEPNLEVEVINETDTELTVAIQLIDEDGEPIDTRDYDDYIEVNDVEMNTDEDGSAVVTLPRSDAPVRVGYEPVPFWERNPTFDSATGYATPTPKIDGVTTPIQHLLITILILWSPVYMYDQVYGTDYWPPWKDVW